MFSNLTQRTRNYSVQTKQVNISKATFEKRSSLSGKVWFDFNFKISMKTTRISEVWLYRELKARKHSIFPLFN